MIRVTHMLSVPVIGQRTSYECGNTALASILQYFGQHYSPTEVGKLCGTNTNGTDHGELVRAALDTGANVFTKANGTLDELAQFVAKGLPALVGWWSMDPGEKEFSTKWTLPQRREFDCGHFSIVCGTKASSFTFMDPQDGDDNETIGLCEKADDTFKRVWYDTDTDAFVRVTRWYMVVNYSGLRFADAFKGGEDHAPPRKRG